MTRHPDDAVLIVFVLGHATSMLGWHRLALRQLDVPSSLNAPTRPEPTCTRTCAGRHVPEHALNGLAVDAVNSDRSMNTTIALHVLAMTCPATMQMS